MVKSGSMENASWHKIAALGVFLLVFLTGLILAVGSSRRSSQPATGWDSHVVESAYAGVRVREIDPSRVAVIFLYDLENRGDADYQLIKGGGVVAMSRLKSTGSFSSEKPVTLTDSAFIPAKSRTRIAVEIPEPFNWPARVDASSENRFRQLVAQEVEDLDGFVIFDETHRYQIELPGAWPEMQRELASPARR